MCGRFALTHSRDDVARHFQIERLDDFPPRYNIAPTQPVLLVIGGSELRPEAYSAGRQGQLARWGLIPGWCKDPSTIPLLFNARSESAASRNSFAGALKYRRCLIPASGFYEWQKTAKGAAQPYYIYPEEGGLIAFAAIMETYLAVDGSELDTVAILTRAAGARLSGLHQREPVTIAPALHEYWLDCHRVGPDSLGRIWNAEPSARWAFHPVSQQVNSAANVSPEIQQPAGPESEAGQSSFPF